MNFRILEYCLTFVEQQIISRSISSTLDTIKDSTCLNSFINLENKENLSLILDQAYLLHSPLRVSSLLCLQIASSNDPVLNNQYYLRLIEPLCEACLYDNVLEIASQCKISDYKTLKLVMLACYRIKRWPMFFEYYKRIPLNQITIDIKLLIVRALLEIKKPFKSYTYFQQIKNQDDKVINQSNIISLLIKQKLGQLKINDINIFFALITIASPSEKAALAPIWSTIESFISEEDYFTNSLAIIINDFWYSFSPFTLVVDGFKPLPSLASSEQIRRLIFVTDNINNILTLDCVVELFKQFNDHKINVDIVYIGDSAKMSNKPIDFIDLSEYSITATTRFLRDMNIDVLIDTIGTSNSRWIEVIAQRVSTYQIGWFAADFSAYFAPFYDYIIVDRWTKPRYLNNFSTKILSFSGISFLSSPSTISHNLSSDLIYPPVDTFIILGRPDELLPGSHQLIRSLLLRYPRVTFHFIDSVWQESGLLDLWWSSEFTDEIAPTQIKSSIDINQNSTLHQIYSPLVLSFNLGSPTYHLSHLLRIGIPVVCLSSLSFQSRSIISLLESLGLGSFITDNIEDFYDIIEAMVSDSDLYMEIAKKLPQQFKSSLTLDYKLFASDLYQSLSLLSR